MNINGKEIKRSHIIAASLVIMGIVLAIIFFMVFRGDADGDGDNSDSFFGVLTAIIEQQPTSPELLQGGVIIGEGEEQEEEEMVLFRVSEDPVIGAALAPDGKRVRYFKHASGHLFETEFTGKNETRISNITIPAILNVQWTPSKTYAVISYYADGEIRRLYSHYSGTSTISSSFLPTDIQEITTSQTDDMIAYTVLSGGETVLFTARPNNTSIKNILTLSVPDFELSWPATNLIALKTKSSAYAPSFLYTLNPASKRMTQLFSEKTGLDALWSPGGDNLSYMETNQKGKITSFRVVSLADNTVTELPIVTLPEKCAWATSAQTRTLYCGIPESIPKNANLPDDWWQGETSFNDALWRVNIDTGERQQLLSPRQLDAINLFLSEDESFLFFTNKKDGLLWSLRLK